MMTLSVAQNFGWSEILWITLIGFGLVFVMLVLLIYIIKLFGVFFTHKYKKSKVVDNAASAEVIPPMIAEDTAAAIAVAFNLYNRERHVQEREIVTIRAIKRASSPWNAKFFSLTQLPERKK